MLFGVKKKESEKDSLLYQIRNMLQEEFKKQDDLRFEAKDRELGDLISFALANVFDRYDDSIKNGGYNREITGHMVNSWNIAHGALGTDVINELRVRLEKYQNRDAKDENLVKDAARISKYLVFYSNIRSSWLFLMHVIESICEQYDISYKGIKLRIEIMKNDDYKYFKFLESVKNNEHLWYLFYQISFKLSDKEFSAIKDYYNVIRPDSKIEQVRKQIAIEEEKLESKNAYNDIDVNINAYDNDLAIDKIKVFDPLTALPNPGDSCKIAIFNLDFEKFWRVPRKKGRGIYCDREWILANEVFTLTRSKDDNDNDSKTKYENIATFQIEIIEKKSDGKNGKKLYLSFKDSGGRPVDQYFEWTDDSKLDQQRWRFEKAKNRNKKLTESTNNLDEKNIYTISTYKKRSSGEVLSIADSKIWLQTQYRMFLIINLT